MPVKISVKRINELRFVPQDKPAMPLTDAVELAMVRHRDALEYLRDKFGNAVFSNSYKNRKWKFLSFN